MGQIISFIMSNLFTILILGAIFYFVFVRGKAKITVGGRQRQVPNAPAAVGISVLPTAGQASGEGVKEYSGNTGGIDWKLRSVVLQSQSSNDSTSTHWTRSTSWHTDSIKFPPTKFLMLMSSGVNVSGKQLERGGFINSLINKAAEFALDIYVMGYFGSQYKDLVNIGDDGVKIDKPALSDFLILTNMEPTAAKFLDDPTVNVIAGWKNQKQGFSREGNVDKFGILFCPEGMILSCQADMANEQEAKMFADFGSVLAVKMREVQA